MQKLGRQKIFWQGLALVVSFFLTVGSVGAASADGGHYRAAKKEYDLLTQTKVTAENRQRWEALAARFEKISREMPRSSYAHDALFYGARIHRELYDFDKKEANLDMAIKNWRLLLLKYPKSAWAQESRLRLAMSYEEGKQNFDEARKQYEALIARAPKGGFALIARRRLDGLEKAEQAKAEQAKKEQARAPDAAGAKAVLTAIRNTSSQNYTRIIMEVSAEIRYETHRLKEDAAKGLPPRIYVDLLGARLAMDSTQPIVVRDGLLRQVRVGQYSSDVVRVVLDMSSLSGYNTFLLPDPYRLVIDIQGKTEGETVIALEKKKEPPPSLESKKAQSATLRKIVLDPGHGGKDSGAVGVGGIVEKDIVLSVAQRLAKKLKSEMGVQVVLTRQDDTFIPLEDRTAIANAEGADLFISLHANASPNSAARGLETYYLDNTTDEAAIRLAARENGTSRKGVTDLQFILSDLTQNSKLEDSITLANRLHSSLVSLIGKRGGEVKDLGVKKAQFFVLVGAKMPSVLVELLFVTNKDEARALKRPSYQNAIIDALYEGIKKYQESTLVVKNL